VSVSPEPNSATSQDDALTRLTGLVALCGGLLAVAVALLVCVSVIGRWLFNAPVEGDFEFVKMATAVAVFAYLPYTQARRGHIFVDTFSNILPKPIQRGLDVLWDLVLAAAMAFCAWGLVVGTRDAMASRETTMQLQLLVWPVIGLSMLLCALASITALLTALRLIRAAR
jgi:TRAP-type C4-dicarboxylate transport system permease small subunit